MNNPIRARRRFSPQQKEEGVALCLAEGLTCTAVPQRLGIPISRLAKWVRQARINRGELSDSGQGPLTSEEGAELVQLRRENREPRREKNCSGWRQLTLP
jgi:transposase-like protein